MKLIALQNALQQPHFYSICQPTKNLNDIKPYSGWGGAKKAPLPIFPL